MMNFYQSPSSDLNDSYPSDDLHVIVDKISNENKTEMMKDKLSKLKCGEQDARN